MICSANQMTGFYIKCKIGLKWVGKKKQTKTNTAAVDPRHLKVEVAN